PIAALGKLLRQSVKLVDADIAQPQRDFLDAGDSQPLPLFEDLHEVAGFYQGFVGPGVKPGETAAEYLDIEVAALEIAPVDVGDLQLATGRRLQRGGDVKHVVVVEVKSGHCHVRLWPGWLFLD